MLFTLAFIPDSSRHRLWWKTIYRERRTRTNENIDLSKNYIQTCTNRNACKRGANQAVLVIHVCEVEGKISADGYPCRLQLCNAIQEWLQECYISKERIELKHRHRQHAAIQSIQEALEVPDAFRKAPRGSAMREFPRSQQVTNFPGWYLQRLSLITEFHLHTASCSRPTGL